MGNIIQFPRENGVEEILKSLGVPLKYIAPDNRILYEHECGVTYKVSTINKYMIYIRNNLSISQKQQTLCHELGHIVMGHMTDDKFTFLTEEQREKEAEQFASFILPYIYKPIFAGGINE